MWIDLLKSIVPDSVLILAVAWLVKSITTHRLSKDVERFKADLQLDGERYKNELSVDAHRRNTVFSRLHERRAEVIAAVYEAVSSAELAVSHYITPFGSPEPPPGKTLILVAVESMWTLVRTADTHRIWFTPATAAKLDEIVVALRKAYNLGASGQRATERQHEAGYEMVMDAWETVSVKVPVLRAALESDFRSLLGVELADKPQETPATGTHGVITSTRM